MSTSPGPDDKISPLPRPSGRFAVGRTRRDWVDHERAEIYSADPEDRRELVVWIWYPTLADVGQVAEPAGYLPSGWEPTGDFLGIEAAGLVSHAATDAPVAPGPAHPVLVLSPSGFPPLLLAATAEDLASHGYVVVGVNHSYETAVTTFGDGRSVPLNPAAIAGAIGGQSGSHQQVFADRAAVCEYKAGDLRFVADQLGRTNIDPDDALAGHLDLDRLGGYGHSFGGDAALEWCRADPRCRAAANLDGALWTAVARAGLDRPALQVLGPHPEFAVTPEQAVATGMAPDQKWFEAEKAVTFGGWQTVDRHSAMTSSYWIAGASHLSFMDVPFLPLRAGGPAAAMLAATRIAPDRIWRIVDDLLLAFFGRQFGDVAAVPGHPGDRYPEVHAGVPDPGAEPDDDEPIH